MKRKNEAKWIVKRKRWQINVQADCVRRTFTSAVEGQKGKDIAESKADAWLEKHLAGEETRCEILLDSFLEKKKKTTSAVNYRQVEYHVRCYIKPAIGRKRISQLTEDDLQDIIDSAYAIHHLAKKTLENIRGTISTFVKFCRKRKVTALRLEGLEIPRKAKKSEKHIAQPEDVRTLFQKNQTTYYNKEVFERCIHAYRFSLITGIRFGELIGLEWSDYDPAREIIMIGRAINDMKEESDGKSDNAKRPRSVKGLARRELDAQRTMLKEEGTESKYIFPDTDGSFFQQKHFRDLWYRYCKHNGITKITPSALRHTFVSINDEMPDGLTKQTLGHSANMDTEGVYGHRKAGDLERIAEIGDASIQRILDENDENKEVCT